MEVLNTLAARSPLVVVDGVGGFETHQAQRRVTRWLAPLILAALPTALRTLERGGDDDRLNAQLDRPPRQGQPTRY